MKNELMQRLRLKYPPPRWLLSMGPNSGCQRNVVKCVVAWGIYGRVVLYKAWRRTC
ncbi:Uncharacterised protein [Salmonella enterica subsp. enterica]|uniref:Uncharacterized protein n=2 Tax=Salmonella enterica I TaxID=59201 RepID=A0A379WUF0_SALET|nr:Uncharacterised protein [Salmonella enterica subsp. enterica]SUH37702.1 Uncharacterised protein [Salmonella enterica subsp. enterica]